ncbi:hypothetical protein LAZ67_13001878 [Cordylochernes scorpioides]|uniref:TRAF-type domain-containing protein n=1 Tax=Cordylochernes scorpioides TaxID=51811 RepID=A0ABY6L7P4_9ARAC|nr:hypothetical protein LAZ67_13001878 [Cordylochernes scorpioides]
MPGHRKRRQFKQTVAFTRGMVIGLKKAGWSIRQIAADTHLGASTVHRLWRRWLEQGNVAIYRNVGATRVTSARVDRRILRQAVAAPQATCTAILQHVQDTLDHSISTRTISRRLVANGLHSCRPLRRLPLTPPNRRQRLEYGRARSTWMTEWHRVVFQMSRVSACPVIVAVYACGVDVEKGPIRQQLWNAPPCNNVESWFGAQSPMEQNSDITQLLAISNSDEQKFLLFKNRLLARADNIAKLRTKYFLHQGTPMKDTACRKINEALLGCGATFASQEEAAEHAETCGYIEKICPLGCGAKLLKKELILHLSGPCTFRNVACTYCGLEVVQNQLNAHQENCDLKSIPCDYCSLGTSKKEMSSHLLECLRKPVPCSFREMGCDFEGEAASRIDHEMDVQLHFPLLGHSMRKLNRLCDNISNNVDDLKSDMNIKDDRTILRQFEKLEYTLQSYDEKFEKKMNLTKINRNELTKVQEEVGKKTRAKKHMVACKVGFTGEDFT